MSQQACVYRDFAVDVDQVRHGRAVGTCGCRCHGLRGAPQRDIDV